MTRKGNTRNYSRGIIMQLLVITVLVVAVLIWQRNFLYDVYVKNQLTTAGWVINGAILALFVIGLARLINLFRRYADEEQSINRFVANMQRRVEPDEGVNPDAIILYRYTILRELWSRRSPINQNILASALIAYESSYVSFPKFVNNVLILTGVFGTIVSLSISLIGASDMVNSTTELGGLGTVIHGMSTALSTTMTAIVCYLFFGYFYMKLLDTQTHLVGRVEQVTTTLLMPRFQLQPEVIMQDFGEMVRATAGLVERMEHNQERFGEAAQMLKGLVADTQQRMSQLDKRFDQINQLLREGFRLPKDD